MISVCCDAKANQCVDCVLMGLNEPLAWYLSLCCGNVAVGVIRSLQRGLKGFVGKDPQ